MRLTKLPIFLLLIIFFLSGCSMQKLAVRSMSGILENSLVALYEEPDLELAQKAIASDIKLLEGLIKTDPNNEKLLLMAAQGFGSYALGFIEDKNPDRAKNFYLRGRNYGLRILNKNKSYRKAEKSNLDEFEKTLKKFGRDDVPAIFWTAYNWAGWINLNFSDPAALADLPRVQLLMQRVIELDDSYFFGGAHLFFAINFAMRPPMLGGDLEKAKIHFDRCFELSNFQFLLPYVYFAQHYLTRQFDEEEFKYILQKVIAAPIDILPEHQFPNAIAQRKAKMLLERVDDLF